jgi:hypothetical protein
MYTLEAALALVLFSGAAIIAIIALLWLVT